MVAFLRNMSRAFVTNKHGSLGSIPSFARSAWSVPGGAPGVLVEPNVLRESDAEPAIAFKLSGAVKKWFAADQVLRRYTTIRRRDRSRPVPEDRASWQDRRVI